MPVDSEFMNWAVAFRHPLEIWEKHPSFLICEITIYVTVLLILKHALRLGGRYIYLLLTVILHGIVVELVCYYQPDIDNFWHAQAMVMLTGKRLPFYIVCIYNTFIYTSIAAVARLNLKKWAQPLAVGLGVVLIDLPYDIMGIKLLWWTWHDTDPNIYDRMYWVPWTSYYFHAAFSSSFAFLFFGSRRLLCSTEDFLADSFFKELLCTIVTALLAMPLGILQFVAVYHTLHDFHDIPTELTVIILVVVYALLVWASDRQPTKEARSLPNKGWFDELGLLLVIYFSVFLALVCNAQPEKNVVTGLHEPVGDCGQVSPVQTASGLVLSKKTYLCVDRNHSEYYNEEYFDFHCLPGGKPPLHGSEWYTICGLPFPNHAEYIAVITTVCLSALFIYYQILANSGQQPKGRVATQPKGVATPSSKKRQ